MTDKINIVSRCSVCHGTGQLTDGSGNPYICNSCNGSKVLSTQMSIDSELIYQILAELDYIHGKVTAIWERVKP